MLVIGYPLLSARCFWPFIHIKYLYSCIIFVILFLSVGLLPFGRRLVSVILFNSKFSPAFLCSWFFTHFFIFLVFLHRAKMCVSEDVSRHRLYLSSGPLGVLLYINVKVTSFILLPLVWSAWRVVVH